MFVSGLAYAVILLPALLGLLIAFLIFATRYVNRRYSPIGWLVPVIAALLAFGWYEKDRIGEANPASKGIVEFGMSDKIDDVRSQSTFKFPVSTNGLDEELFTGDVVDVRFQTGNGVIEFPKVGGLSNSLLSINFRTHPSGVSFATFGAQHTPLKLEDALGQARHIEAQLLKAGFIPQAQGPHCQKFQPITATVPGQIITVPKSWIEAADVLSDSRFGITEMNLFCVTGKTATVTLKLENWSRGTSSIFSHNFGRDWGLIVTLESWTPRRTSGFGHSGDGGHGRGAVWLILPGFVV